MRKRAPATSKRYSKQPARVGRLDGAMRVMCRVLKVLTHTHGSRLSPVARPSDRSQHRDIGHRATDHDHGAEHAHAPK